MITNSDPLTDKDHDRIAFFIDRVAGIQLPYHKRSLIESRLRRRQKEYGHVNLTDYIDFALQSNSSEQVYLIDALTTNKTYFFREKSHFDYLAKVVNEINPQQDLLRIWSAGSSSGEEAYTLALVLSELQHQNKIKDFSILATDISISALATARNAVYSYERLEDIPKNYRRRYLLKSKDISRKVFRISPEIRKKVVFDTFNLVTDDYSCIGKQDIIFCRNVMIYFNSIQKNKIITAFHKQLTNNGLLFIGHSEGLIGKNTLLTQLIPTVYRKN